MPLRPYQLLGAQRGEAALAGHANVLVSMATGTGKTHVFAHLAIRAVRSGWRVLILVHREELAAQALRVVLSEDPHQRVGIVQAEREEWEPITIAMVQSMTAHRRTRMPLFHLVITDEAHHAPSPSYQAVYAGVRKQYLNARHFGMTATPYRAEGTRVASIVRDEEGAAARACFDVLAYQYGLRDGMRDGALVPELTAVRVPTGQHLRVRGGEYRVADLNNDARNQLIVATYADVYPQFPPALAFCVDVAHAKALAWGLRERGIPARAVYGNMDAKEGPGTRRRALQDHADGVLRVLTTVNVLAEGFDAPHTRALLMARPTRSLNLLMQQVGRVTRPAPGKSRGVVLDFTDNLDGGVDLAPAGLDSLADGEWEKLGRYDVFRVRGR